MTRGLPWIVAVVALAGSGFAVEPAQVPNLDKGTRELQIGGEVDFDTAAGDEVRLDVGLGAFVADNLEIGGAVGILNNDLLTLWALGAFGELNLPVDAVPVVPFVGTGLSWAYADPERGDSEDALVLSLVGGGKYFITPDLAAALQLNFKYASEDIFLEEDGVADTDWNLTLGLRYYFD